MNLWKRDKDPLDEEHQDDLENKILQVVENKEFRFSDRNLLFEKAEALLWYVGKDEEGNPLEGKTTTALVEFQHLFPADELYEEVKESDTLTVQYAFSVYVRKRKDLSIHKRIGYRCPQGMIVLGSPVIDVKEQSKEVAYSQLLELDYFCKHCHAHLNANK
jgi:hypothetical protein